MCVNTRSISFDRRIAFICTILLCAMNFSNGVSIYSNKLAYISFKTIRNLQGGPVYNGDGVLQPKRKTSNVAKNAHRVGRRRFILHPKGVAKGYLLIKTFFCKNFIFTSKCKNEILAV
jgi:hypothetical protein